MFVVIKKQGTTYELQHKASIESRVVSFCERSSNPDILKMSLTLDWKPYNKDDIVWVAEYGS